MTQPLVLLLRLRTIQLFSPPTRPIHTYTLLFLRFYPGGRASAHKTLLLRCLTSPYKTFQNPHNTRTKYLTEPPVDVCCQRARPSLIPQRGGGERRRSDTSSAPLSQMPAVIGLTGYVRLRQRAEGAAPGQSLGRSSIPGGKISRGRDRSSPGRCYLSP